MQQQLFTVTVIATIVFMFSCSNSKKDLSIFDKNKISQEESKNITSYLSQGGVMKARLFAPKMIRYTSDSIRVEFPQGQHTEFFLENKDLVHGVDTNIVESHIFSKYGRYTEFNNKVYLKDSVLCYNALKKDTLWCDDLWWDQDKQVIFTWGKFRFKTHDGQDMKGNGEKTGFTAKQDLTEYTLYNSTGVMIAPAGTLPSE
jgi:hypothetical protein